jgi:hypothetical protein
LGVITEATELERRSPLAANAFSSRPPAGFLAKTVFRGKQQWMNVNSNEKRFRLCGFIGVSGNFTDSLKMKGKRTHEKSK